jgi:hypothetical protein
MPQQGSPIIITPVVDASGPMKIVHNLETRLGEGQLMGFLRTVVSPYMGDQIVQRFAYGGDKAVGGPWPPLAAYTERLKRSLGAPSDAPNERTGDMMAHLAYDHHIGPLGLLGAELRIPDKSDGLMEKKIRVAQEGESAESNPIGGATPARPVLGISDTDEKTIAALFDAYLWTGIT